jgi:polyhydroxybutyrate depolymerase
MEFARLTVRRCGHLALAAFGLVVCLTGGGAGHAWAIPDQPERLDFGGLVRTYSLHVPAGLEHPAGLVVNLHGAGATGRDQEAATNYDAVADAHGFIVVYPDGIDFSWADGRGPSQPDRQGIDDVGFITTLAGKLVADFGVDPGHVFATGRIHGQPARLRTRRCLRRHRPGGRDPGCERGVLTVAAGGGAGDARHR